MKHCGRLVTLLIPQLREVILIHSEVVPDFVEQRYANLISDRRFTAPLIAFIIDPPVPAASMFHDPFTKEVNHLQPRLTLHGTLGERGSGVQPEQFRLIVNPHLTSQMFIRCIIDDQRFLIE